jgi:hypothetical protein
MPIFALRKLKNDKIMLGNHQKGKRLFLLACSMLTLLSTDAIAQNENTTMDKMYITIDGHEQSVTLTNNSATKALVEKLQQAPVDVTLNSSGGFEIWGALGFSLPTSDQQTNAQPGDVVLYNGSNICMFYGSNSWSYTRLGKIDGLSESELRTFLKAGESNIKVTLSLTSGTTAIKSINNNLQEDETYYSLNGQRVEHPTKGLFIRNGKKVIIL